jgi:hypothetical protein
LKLDVGMVDHPAPVLVNTKAEPVDDNTAPTIATLPETATEYPNQSALSVPVRTVVGVVGHDPPVLV